MNRFIKQKQQLGIFITAGYPELESTEEQLRSIQDAGADFIEVGMPFSDPMADGPAIQKSSMIALKNGMNLKIMFSQLMSAKNDIDIPIVLMGYFNPVLNYGIENFFKDAEKSGVSGIIIPDLSPEIHQHYFAKLTDQFNIPLIHLITPETSNERILKIAELSKNGFIYLVSSNATTGAEQDFELRKRRYKQIKNMCSPTPVFIGFGLKSKADIDILDHETCDGHIIGSAYIQKIENGQGEQFLKELIIK